MDLNPDSKGQECACPTDARIARYFDAKVAERLAKCQDRGLVAVSQRLADPPALGWSHRVANTSG